MKSTLLYIHDNLSDRRKNMQKCDGKEKPIILGCKNNTLNSSIIQLFIFLLVWTMIWISYAYFRIMMNADTFQSRVNNLNIAQKKMDVQTKRSNGASACLIIKDENPRLIEWIAYHYQVLPLKHLIITSDPSAITSPTTILNRWRKDLPDLEIIEWNDQDYSFNQTWAESKGANDAFFKALQFESNWEL